MTDNYSDKAALRGEPSYVWRAGQERRLKMIREAAGDRLKGVVFENGLGWGHIWHVWQGCQQAIGLDVELERTIKAHQHVATGGVWCW